MTSEGDDIVLQVSYWVERQVSFWVGNTSLLEGVGSGR
jgi:hypothetical protein